MPKKIIHVNQQRIKDNAKLGRNDPVVTVKGSGDNHYGFNVHIVGSSHVIYSPDKPLSCGARVWIETLGIVWVDGVRVT